MIWSELIFFIMSPTSAAVSAMPSLMACWVGGVKVARSKVLPAPMLSLAKRAMRSVSEGPSETDLMARFAKLNIGAGKTFDLATFTPPTQQAINDGIADTAADVGDMMKKINSDQIMSSAFFGTRDYLKNNY